VALDVANSGVEQNRATDWAPDDPGPTTQPICPGCWEARAHANGLVVPHSPSRFLPSAIPVEAGGNMEGRHPKINPKDEQADPSSRFMVCESKFLVEQSRQHTRS